MANFLEGHPTKPWILEKYREALLGENLDRKFQVGTQNLDIPDQDGQLQSLFSLFFFFFWQKWNFLKTFFLAQNFIRSLDFPKVLANLHWGLSWETPRCWRFCHCFSKHFWRKHSFRFLENSGYILQNWREWKIWGNLSL